MPTADNLRAYIIKLYDGWNMQPALAVMQNKLFPFVDGDYSLGTSFSRFKEIFAFNGYFSGNVSVAEPTADEHAATKKYVDDNASGGNDIRRTNVQLDIVVPAGLPLDTPLALYDIESNIVSVLTGDLLNSTEDNRLRLIQNSGIFQAQAKIVNMDLVADYKTLPNNQFIDFNAYARQSATNTFKRILAYRSRSTTFNSFTSHSSFDSGFTDEVLAGGRDLYLIVERKFNNTDEIKAKVNITIDYQL